MLRITAVLVVLLLLGLIALYVLEFRWFDRTIGMRNLALYAMAIGVLLGVALGRRFSPQGRNTVEKVQLYVFFIFICTLFAPLAASLSNRLLSLSAPRLEHITFFEEQAFYSDRYGLIKGERVEPDGYYTFFYYHGRLRRIKSEQPLLPGRERGETAELRIKRGLWGYDVVVVEVREGE